MEIKIPDKKSIQRTYRQSHIKIKKTISDNYTEKNNKLNNSKMIKKDSFKNIKIKNDILNKVNKSKAFSKKLYIEFNTSNKDNSLYNINNIFINRKSFPLTQKNNKKIINHKRFTLKTTLKKKLTENNLTTNDVGGNKNLKYINKIKNTSSNTKLISLRNRERNRKNQSEIKNRKYKQMTLDIMNYKKIKIKQEKKVKLRRSNILRNKKIGYENLNIDLDIKEIKDENEIRNKVLRHNTTVFNFEKNIFLFDEEKKAKSNNININTNNINNNSNYINDDLLRFSNISKINHNDLFYLNNNHIYNNFTESTINPKIEKIEGEESNELIEFDEKLLEEIVYNNEEKQQKKIVEQKVSMPCLNCGKLISIDEIDEHSNECFKMKKDKNNNYIIIENKLKNILEYLEKIEKNGVDKKTGIIQELKTIVENILTSQKKENLSNVNNTINKLMEKYINDANYFTLMSRIKILLEEKIKFYKIDNGNGDWKQKNKNFRKNSAEENIENISENETTEFFDLKKMEKILDEKELKNQNLDKLINETKNKRLFLMEVLKVKFQKIKENKNEDLITPEMIWNEALKKNIDMNNWSKFIFNELNNPNKYLKMIQKKIK